MRPSSESNSDRQPPGGGGARRSRGGSRRRLRIRCSRFEAVAQLRQQLEYFFSIGILCKDVFLRTQMDVGGFVDLAALSRFGLIAALAADAAELADAACGSCGVLETTDVKSFMTGACRVWPRVLGARRTPQQRGGSWVLGRVACSRKT